MSSTSQSKSASGTLRTQIGADVHEITLHFTADYSLGAGTVSDQKCAEHPFYYHGRRISGLLKRLTNTSPISARFPVTVPHESEDAVRHLLTNAICDNTELDSTIIYIANCCAQDLPGLNSVFLLDRTQVWTLNHVDKKRLSVKLPTNQVISSLTVAEISGEEGQPENLDRYVAQPLPLTRINTKYTPFQHYPSSEVTNVEDTHAYSCLLNACDWNSIRTRFVLIRNPNLFRQDDQVGSIAVPVERSNLVPTRRICLDDTVARATGLREGEVCDVVGVAFPWSIKYFYQKRLWRNRHLVARIVSSNSVDMEKPICRLSHRAMDVLGVDNGETVVIENIVVNQSYQADWRSVTLRVLIEREQTGGQLSGEGIFEDIHGHDDIPLIKVDLATRRRLGVSRGSAVYVRPSVLSGITGEIYAGFFFFSGFLVWGWKTPPQCRYFCLPIRQDWLRLRWRMACSGRLSYLLERCSTVPRLGNL